PAHRVPADGPLVASSAVSTEFGTCTCRTRCPLPNSAGGGGGSGRVSPACPCTRAPGHPGTHAPGTRGPGRAGGLPAVVDVGADVLVVDVGQRALGVRGDRRERRSRGVGACLLGPRGTRDHGRDTRLVDD